MKRPARLLLPTLLFIATPLGAAVVMDQIGIPTAYNFGDSVPPNASQIFDDFPTFDSMALDDFTVTNSELRLTGVSALFEARAGFASFQGVLAYHVSFFSNPNLAGNSLVGDTADVLIMLGAGATVNQINAGDHGVVNLSMDILLPGAGTYWVGVAPVSSKAVTGQFYLQNSGAQGAIIPGGADGYFANPDEGYGIGQVTQSNLDYAYAVSVVPEPGATVLLVIAGLGLMGRNRRHPMSFRQL